MLCSLNGRPDVADRQGRVFFILNFLGMVSWLICGFNDEGEIRVTCKYLTNHLFLFAFGHVTWVCPGSEKSAALEEEGTTKVTSIHAAVPW